MRDPVTLRKHVLPRAMAGGDMVLLEKYEEPGMEREDPHQASDMDSARKVWRMLGDIYPGYTWGVVYDATKGYCFIMLPILTGCRDGFFINLRTHQADLPTVRNAGGLLLECYRQSRTGLNLASFLEARAKHSKLVVPSRPIPV